jgi:hypothetical protein
MPVPLATQKAECGLKPVWANSSQDPISKMLSTKKKWTGGVAYVVEHLPSKHEALNSSPNTTKKNKIKMRTRKGGKKG